MAAEAPVVRKALPGDAARLAELANAHNRFDGITDDVFTADVILRHAFGVMPHYRCHVAVNSADQVVGYVNFSPLYIPERATPGLFIIDLFVDAAVRRHGVGQELIKSVAAVARKEGFSTVAWTAWTQNTNARRFYRRLGAKETNICYYELNARVI